MIQAAVTAIAPGDVARLHNHGNRCAVGVFFVDEARCLDHGMCFMHAIFEQIARVSSPGAKCSRLVRAVYTTCSAARAPPVCPPCHPPRWRAEPLCDGGCGKMATRSCCSLRSPWCWAAQASMVSGMAVPCGGRILTPAPILRRVRSNL